MDITARNFSVSIKGSVITSRKDLDAHSGEIVQLVGENGSGKTAFLQCCAGIIPHITGGNVRGELFIDGTHLKDCTCKNLQGKVVYVPSAIDMFFMCNTLFEELVFTLAGSNPDTALSEIHSQARFIILEYGLVELKDKEISSLSYGQRAKIAALCAVVSQAPIILLDEVMSSLDSARRSEIQSLIDVYVNDGGLCIVADHDYAWNNATTFRFDSPTTHSTVPHTNDIHGPSNLRGRLIALTGDNGSGKTTLLRHLAGFVEKSDLFERAYDLVTNLAIEQPLAYMPQECRHMFRQLKLRDEFDATNQELLDALDLNDLLDQNPSTLSYGQQKRAALGLTLATGAKTFLLDEPTRGLDIKTAEAVLGILKDFCEHNDVTIICATHDLALIKIADQTFSLLPEASSLSEVGVQ